MDRFNALLEATGSAIRTDDAGAFRARVCLPVVLETPRGSLLSATDDVQLADLLHRMHMTYLASGADRLVMTGVDLVPASGGAWVGVVQTDLLRGATRMAPSHRGLAALVTDGNGFRLSRLQSALLPDRSI